MTRQRTVVGLLAVVAVLLGLNLIVGGASAQPEPEIGIFPPPPVPEPTVVGITITRFPNIDANLLVRVWSDGVIEENLRLTSGVWVGWEVVPEVP